MYVCEDCGHTTSEPEIHYLHLKENHPYSPALLKFYDKRHFKFTNANFASMLLQVNSWVGWVWGGEERKTAEWRKKHWRRYRKKEGLVCNKKYEKILYMNNLWMKIFLCCTWERHFPLHVLRESPILVNNSYENLFEIFLKLSFSEH